MNLLLKINDLIDIDYQYDLAIKKSIEFFIGKIIDIEKIKEFRQKTCPISSVHCVDLFLKENNIYLREQALKKKLSEYLFGKEMDGLISLCSLKIPKKLIDKLSDKYHITLFSTLTLEQTAFILDKFKLKMDMIIKDDLILEPDEKENFTLITSNKKDKEITNKIINIDEFIASA